jgi:hypothetical protein
MFRRSQYLDKRKSSPWDAWWRLGRRLVERRLAVLPVPLDVPALLVGAPGVWFTVCPENWTGHGVVKPPLIGVYETGGEALVWQSGHWTVSFETALALGIRGWDALVQGVKPDSPVSCPTSSDALTLIGAMGRQSAVFHALNGADWPLAARLMRHPHRRAPADHPISERWGFRYDETSHEAWWDGQDEDSVHSR